MDKCKELFLEDIVEIAILPVKGCILPIPAFVENITQMRNCTFPTPVLVIGQEDNMIPFVEGSMAVKITNDISASGTIYSYDISVNTEDDTDGIGNTIYNIGNKDHYVRLRKRDGSILLCYTLPNTFLIKTPVTIKGTKERQISISLKASSEPISIG